MKMWSFRSEELPGNNGLHFAVDLDARPAAFADVLGAWQDDTEFRSLFNAELAGAPYTAFRWETPPVTDSTLSRPFEFVLLDSPGLARRPDANAFAEHFEAASEEGIVVFPNLGGDAIMVVPSPLTFPDAYGHLAAFVREAPEGQADALWRSVGEAMARRWLGELEPGQCGSALLGVVCHGFMYVSTIDRSITATGRTERTLGNWSNHEKN